MYVWKVVPSHFLDNSQKLEINERSISRRMDRWGVQLYNGIESAIKTEPALATHTITDEAHRHIFE